MDSVLKSEIDYGSHEYRALNSGLYYTSAYYEEDQLYCDEISPINEPFYRRTKNLVNTPIEINEHSSTVVDLPPIEWKGYETPPKILSISNTGRTILINGQWIKGRPYIQGGPLNGNYIFSQIHFHSPSEHELGGKRYPLEMHAVHYKTSYLTQERAMRERDGTVVLVYLFQVTDEDQTSLPFITKLTPEIEKANTRAEITDFTLHQIVQPFSSNYYIYWGSVMSEKNSYLLQWIINGSVLQVNQKEADQLLNVLNSGSIAESPRMKPENNVIYYVEEIPPEPQKEEPKYECNICHIYQEWWLNHYNRGCYSHASEDQQIEGEIVAKNSDMIISVEQQTEECLLLPPPPPPPPPPSPSPSPTPSPCPSQPAPPRVQCRYRRTFSGMRVCCCHTRKKLRKSCCNRTPSNCSCKPPSEASICIEERKCKRKKKFTVKSQESSSCPSVSTDVEICEEETSEQEVEVKKEIVKRVCSNSSANKCSTQVCKSKSKGKKAKMTCEVIESSGNECAVACTTKEDNDCCTSVKEILCKKSATGKKKKKTFSNKKTRKKSKEKCCESGCEIVCTCTSSKSSAGIKQKKSSKKCKEPQIECMQFSSMPEKSFEEILREYDTNWLVDSKLKLAKSDSKLSTESLETAKSSLRSTKSPSFIEYKDTITTLYEKKRSAKPPLYVEDCTVNFLLSPNNRRSNPSSLVMSQKSLLEEFKSFQNPESRTIVADVSLNPLTFSGVKQPTETRDESGAKELCIQVELLINTENKDFSGCISQEYNFALMYNQNILQEYKGVFRPNKLNLGDYEKLELVPKYPEPDSVCISVQDCIIKMETLAKLCMRAKFLLKEINSQSLPKLSIREVELNSEKNIPLNTADAVTQYSDKKLVKPSVPEMGILKKNSLNQDLSEPEQSRELIKSSDTLKVAKQDIKSIKVEQSFEQLFLKDGLLEDQESKTKLVEKRVNLEEGNKELINSERLVEEKKCKEESSKSFPKTDGKELKHLFSNKKKHVYFICEKVEKDENSGKKILVGSFRSKDEVEEALCKDKKPNNEQTDAVKNNALVLHNSSKGVLNKIEEDVKVHSSSDTRNVTDEKGLITLHKFKPKHLGVTNPKKERLNLVVGRLLNELERDSKSFKRLADLVGMTQKGNSKISVYELQQSPENASPSAEDASACVVAKESQNIAIQIPEFTSRTTSSSKTYELNSSPEESQKDLSKKPSQSAVIVIPVEVESLSKVEVILVEHSDSLTKNDEKDGKEVVPCLDYSS